jgi:NAD(P) transhydrogenase subunit alpha
VSASLHTPLMSVTNAISGIIIIGGMLQISSSFDAASVLGALAALFAAINIAGGFLVTERMLRMFRREVK